MNRAEWEALQIAQAQVKPAEPYQVGKTFVDVFGNVLYSALKSLEGIYDLGATAVGAVGGLFDKEFQDEMKEHIAYDWVGQNINLDLEEYAEGSLISRMGEKGQNIVRGVAQGIGQMLPSTAVNMLLPGAGLATLGASAAGTGVEQAYQEGATYGEGAAYGILTGAVEMATEKLTGGFTKGAFGKGWLDDAIDAAIGKVSKSALFKFAMTFAEEGFEEVLSAAVEPTLRTIYQEGAYKETFTKEHAEEMLYEGLVGGLTGVVYGGTIGQIGIKTRNAAESAQELRSIEQKRTQLWEKGKLDDAQTLKLDARKEAVQVELKKRLGKLADKKKTNLIRQFELDIDETGEFREYNAEEGYNKNAYSAALHGKESVITHKPITTELTDAQKTVIDTHMKLNKVARTKTNIVIAEDAGMVDGQKVGAFYDNTTKTIYVSKDISDTEAAKFKTIHEVTHSLENLGDSAFMQYKESITKALMESEAVKAKLGSEKWMKSIEQRYAKQLENKSETEKHWILTTELAAEFAEKLFSDEKVITRLTQENRTLAQKIYNKIKNYIEYWKSLQGKSAEEKEYLAFLRKAETLYKKALDESVGGVDLKTVRKIGELTDEIEKSESTDDTRKSIDSDGIRYALEDFGEKIGGARKDVWMARGLESGDLTYLNDAEAEKYIKKDYVWRPINYKKLFSEGTERGTLYLYKLTRDSIPTTLYISSKASQDVKQQKRAIYVDTINKIKNGIEKVKTADDLAKLRDEIFVEPGYLVKQGDRYSTTSLFYDNPALDVALFNNWNRTIKMFDRLDAWAQKEKIGLGSVEKKLADYKIHQNEDGKYYLFKKSWGNSYSQVSDIGFENEDVANSILRMAVEKEQTAKQVKRKERIVPPQLKTINRKGIDYRSNKNVIGDDYLSVFKFRGGEFGNWLSELDRQTSLNYGYDALMDLADALNISREGISLNGDLAIAFGARGQGLSSAAAHYELERRVINLTKMNGAGSLAHEWFHAVDHYIAGKDSRSLMSQLSSFDEKIPAKTRTALQNVIAVMRYNERLQTATEINAGKQRVYESAKRVVDRAFSDYFTNYFEVDKTPEWLTAYGKNRRNATAEEKAKYQTLKKRVYEGDAEAWVELDKLRKTVFNKQIPRSDSTAASYTFTQIYYQIPQLDIKNKQAAYGTQEAPTVREMTEYYRNSKRMDEIAQKDGGYWESAEEMLARAFATYIHDKTSGNNDYLSAHAEAMVAFDVGKDEEIYVLKAYPEGEERAKINKAFDVLFDAMKADGYFQEFAGVRPLQIISYRSTDKGESGQTLFTQEPMTERKEPQIKEVIKEKETSEMPMTPTTEFHSKPTQIELFGEDKAVQLSLFDDNTRFSIISADDKTVYDERAIKKAMADSIAEQLRLGNQEYGDLTEMAAKDLAKLIDEELRTSKDKQATARKIAEFIVQNAVVENASDITGATAEDYRLYNTLKQYKQQFNLDGIKEDVKYIFGKDSSVFWQWGKRKGTQGLSPDVIAQELKDEGVHIDAINPADIFQDFVRMYREVSDVVNKRVKDTKRTIAASQNGFMVDMIVNDLAKDILNAMETHNRPAMADNVIKDKNKQIKALNKDIKKLSDEIVKLENEVGEQTEKSKQMRADLWMMQHDYSRLNIELAESKGKVRTLVEIVDEAKADIRRISNKLYDAQRKHRAEMAMFERIDKIKNLQKYAGSGIKLADEVVALVKLLQKGKTWRGNISPRIREIMRTYARTTDGKPLYDILLKDENPLATEIQAIANNEGDLSLDEIRSLTAIFDNFVHAVNEYDRVFFDGKKQSEKEIATVAVTETTKTVPFRQDALSKAWRKFDNWLEAPYWRFARLSNYDESGYMAKMFWELRNALNKRDEFSMKVAQHFKPFYEKNQKLVDSWRKKITVSGIEMSKGQAMALYLSALREQMQGHLYNRSTTEIIDKDIIVTKKGTIKLTDDTRAIKSTRDAFDYATEVEITEEFVNGLLAEFNAEEREFLRLTYDFFNKMSADAKTQTDMELYGIKGELEKHYFPIRVSDDQIFRKIGDAKPFAALFTVYNPSFTKKTVQGAKNMVVIENITDVIARHARQMADYYGFANTLKTYTRIWNAKTEDGTLRQTVAKVDPEFERYVDKLFKDMQNMHPEREGFDKFISKMMGWGATAALGANPKVWVNQMVALFSAHGIGFDYGTLLRGLKQALKQKGDFSKMFEHSPFLYARFSDGFNMASGAMLESKRMFGKISKLTELTLVPIEYMDKLMIAGVWNAALIQTNNDYAKAAELTQRAVIITQQNFTPLFRPSILRSNSSLLRISTMFMSEPFQIFSQLFGAIDKWRTAKYLLKNATAAEEMQKAESLMTEARKNSKFAFTTVTVNLVLLTLIAQAFQWIKGKRDEEETFAQEFGKELLDNFIGIFPFLRDAYSLIEGYDVTNMAYTGLTNITNAATEIFTSFGDAVQGKYQSGQEIRAGIRKTIIGLSQTFGLPVRNIEAYIKGIAEKVSPSFGERYESWFWKKSDAEYQKILDEAIEKGQDRLADTVIDLLVDRRIPGNKNAARAEIKRLYAKGEQVLPPIINPTITHNGEEITMSARDYKQFAETYSQADHEIETLVTSRTYQLMTDAEKAVSLKLMYDYYFNLAKSELLGEDTSKMLALAKTMPLQKMIVTLAKTKTLEANKDKEGKSITGSRKYKVQQALVGLYLTQRQRDEIMKYLGYAV